MKRALHTLIFVLVSAVLTVSPAFAATTGTKGATTHRGVKVRCRFVRSKPGRVRRCTAVPAARNASKKKAKARAKTRRPVTHGPRPQNDRSGHASAARPIPGVRAGSPGVTCDLVAALSGSDGSGDGSVAHPFATVVRLDRALAPGQTGCLRAGTYGGTHVVHELDNSGTSSARITITSYPGETATIAGWVSMFGNDVTLSDVRIDGSNNFYSGHSADNGTGGCNNGTSQALSIEGHDNVLEYVDYFQSVATMRGVGIGIGFGGGGDNTIVRYSRIHDVGGCMAYDHLIYLSHGNNVRIYGNWLWNDFHGRGVQLYPAPTNARVYDNVIDHVGEGFVIGNEAGETVAGNEIYHNIISNSVGLRWQGIPGEAIHDLYGGSPGTGNSFHDNIEFNNPGGFGHVTAVRTYHNSATDPHFVNAAAHHYQLTTSSPALGWSTFRAA
jgi:hypothetical protein